LPLAFPPTARRRGPFGPLASRRSTAALAKTLRPWLSPVPRFMVADNRSAPRAASSWRTCVVAGRASFRTARGRGYEPHPGHRSRSINRPSPVDVPSNERDAPLYPKTGRIVKIKVTESDYLFAAVRSPWGRGLRRLRSPRRLCLRLRINNEHHRTTRCATTGPSALPQKHHVGLARRDRHAIISVFPTRGLFRHARAWLRIPLSCAPSSLLF
jgi:hypothetical protein